MAQDTIHLACQVIPVYHPACCCWNTLPSVPPHSTECVFCYFVNLKQGQTHILHIVIPFKVSPVSVLLY